MGVGSSKKLATSLAIFVTLLFSLMTGGIAHAQVTGATVSGTVTDPSGGVVANAAVSATNTATAVTRDAMSDSAGLYTIANLVAGVYEIKVSAAGFSTSVQSGLALAVGQQLQLNFALKVGNTSTTVQVTEAAPQIDLTSSAVSGQVESETVRELPLNGRDWTSLAVLQPGVKPIETQMAFATSARGNRGFGGELTVSGQRSTFNNYRIDGIVVSDYAMSSPGNVIGVVLGVDSIQEFSVLTGGFPAEYGRATGGVVNAITRSGTNQFHGAVYEFLRNSALDSNDFFSRVGGTPKPPFKRNQFGVSAGAPIIKDRLFVFADYEGLRQTKGIPQSSTVFSDAVHNGILGSGAAVGAAPGTPCTTAGGAPGQYISAASNTCFANYAVALLPLWPHATGLQTGDTGNFVFAGVQSAPENFGTIKLDYTIGKSDTMFGTFLRDPANYTQPDGFGDVGSVSSTSRTTFALEENHTFGSSLVNVARVGFNRDNVKNLFTPNAINPLAADTTTADAIPLQTAPRLTVKGGVTDFFGGTESGSHYLHVWNSYQYYDDVIWTHGNHTVKFGGGAERMDYNEHTFQNPGGRYIFGGGLPGSFGDYRDFFNGLPSHFEGGLLNIIDEPREFRQTTFAAYVQDDWKFKPNLTFNIGLRYEPTTVLKDAQGRITNLPTITSTTLTCGSPFSVSAPPFNLPVQPGTSCGNVGPYYNNATTKNFEPRIGFAWDPFKNGKTSIRGSFGLYDVDPFAGYFLLQQNQAGPFLVFKSVTDTAPTSPLIGPNFVAGGGGAALANSTASNLSESTVEGSPHRTYVDEWGLTIQRQLTSDMSLTVGYVGSHGLHLLTRGDDGNMAGAPGSPVPYTTTPYGYLFPCGFPNAGAAGQSCSPGTFGGTPTGGGGLSNQLNPTLGVIRYIYWNGSAHYNGLNVNLEKRFSHNLQFQVAYTFSKSQDDTSQTIAGDTFGNGINSPWWFLPQAFYGPSDFNVAHTLSINSLYTIPTPKTWSGAMNEGLAGWELGGIFTFNSGTPTTPINQGDPLGLGNGGADQFGPVVQLPGCNPVSTAGSAPGKPNWINASCFTEPYMPTSFANSLVGTDYQCAPTAGTNTPAGNTGCLNLAPFNIGRNSITGPHFVNLDFSVHKTFPITRISEAFNIQFRAEFFDIANHANFVPPQPNSGDSKSGILNPDGTQANPAKFGFITQYANAQQPSREIQLALKVQW